MFKRVYKYKTTRNYSRYFEWLDDNDVELNEKWLTVKNGIATVKPRYAHDGCTPKFKIGGKIYGVWDGANDEARFPSMWHDVFTQYNKDLTKQGITRKEVDLQFREDLIEYKHLLPNLYYIGVRAFGWIFWI